MNPGWFRALWTMGGGEQPGPAGRSSFKGQKATTKAKGEPANKRPRSRDCEPAGPITDKPATDGDDDDDALSGDA